MIVCMAELRLSTSVHELVLSMLLDLLQHRSEASYIAWRSRQLQSCIHQIIKVVHLCPCDRTDWECTSLGYYLVQ